MRPLPGCVDQKRIQLNTLFRLGEPKRRIAESALKYQQWLGRVMRPPSGIVDGDKCSGEYVSRKRAIAESAKPHATVLDFVGNSGRHKLITAVDILGGEMSKRTRELVEQELRKSGRTERVDELVIEAEQREHQGSAARAFSALRFQARSLPVKVFKRA